MRKVLFLMIFSILLLTGCTVEYNLDIDENMNIYEYVNINMTESDYMPIVERQYNLQKEYLDNNNYNSEYTEEEITIKNNFKNYNEYLERSEFYSQYFESFLITEKDGLIYIQTTGNFYKYVMNPTYDKYHIEETNINIKLPFKVISNNADKVDEENGIYTWTITDKTLNKKIELVFNKNQKEFKLTKEMLFISLGVIGILLVIGIIIFMKKSSKNNEL